MAKAAPRLENIGKRMQAVTMIHDLDTRFRLMDEFGDYGHVISLPNPPLEDITEPGGRRRSCPRRQRRHGGVGAQALRAFSRLRRGAGHARHGRDHERAAPRDPRSRRPWRANFTNIAGEPLDLPKFQPVFDAMAEYDLPIWMHPARAASMADYASEERSRFEMWWCFGWPYETSVAMARLVFSGLFDRHPNIKIVTHHMGGMIPFLRRPA